MGVDVNVGVLSGCGCERVHKCHGCGCECIGVLYMRCVCGCARARARDQLKKEKNMPWKPSQRVAP